MSWLLMSSVYIYNTTFWPRVVSVKLYIIAFFSASSGAVLGKSVVSR